MPVDRTFYLNYRSKRSLTFGYTLRIDMKYIFGPVPSRRLGLSLGIDLIPGTKTCNMDCIYCELGRGRGSVCEVREYSPFEDIMEEIRYVVASRPDSFDCLTFTASGEPTLHSRFGELLIETKKITRSPVVVLTNAGLASRKEVRDTLSEADLVLPSLDAAVESSFRKINRPDPCIDLEELISGLSMLRNGMKGQMWLEVLLVKGINDSDEDILALKEAVSIIRPHKIQLNTVVRPPAESFASPIPQRRMKEIRSILGDNAEIIVDYSAGLRAGSSLLLESEILDMLKRRPMSRRDMERLFGEYEKADEILSALLKRGVVKEKMLQSEPFYVVPRAEIDAERAEAD